MNRFDAFCERFWVPARVDTLASFSVIQPSRSRRHDAATRDAIQKQTAKSPRKYIIVAAVKCFMCRSVSENELSNTIRQCPGASIKNHRPNSGDLRIEFNQGDVISKIKFG